MMLSQKTMEMIEKVPGVKAMFQDWKCHYQEHCGYSEENASDIAVAMIVLCSFEIEAEDYATCRQEYWG